jgi:hypothetical protein
MSKYQTPTLVSRPSITNHAINAENYAVNGGAQLYGDQSVSITPPSGAMPALAALGELETHRFHPGGVRNSAGPSKVTVA